MCESLRTVTVVPGNVCTVRNTMSCFIFLQWAEAGATVGGARLAEVPPLSGTVYVIGALVCWENRKDVERIKKKKKTLRLYYPALF